HRLLPHLDRGHRRSVRAAGRARLPALAGRLNPPARDRPGSPLDGRGKMGSEHGSGAVAGSFATWPVTEGSGVSDETEMVIAPGGPRRPETVQAVAPGEVVRETAAGDHVVEAAAGTLADPPADTEFVITPGGYRRAS